MLTYMEGDMPAIERILDYGTLPDENDEDKEYIKENSSSKLKQSELDQKKGVTISNLIMRYRPELPTALNGLNLHINPKEHVAVVGRTGSGKSSLALSLFRLYKPEIGYSLTLDNE